VNLTQVRVSSDSTSPAVGRSSAAHQIQAHVRPVKSGKISMRWSTFLPFATIPMVP